MKNLFPEDRIYILDGAMGTMIQTFSLTENDYRGEYFASCAKDLKGNNECLNITRPDVIEEIHRRYIEAGADIITTNTFSANSISQSEYGCSSEAFKMAYEGARNARRAADSSDRKILVAGSMGPTSKSLSLSPDLSDPAFRPYSFKDMKEAFKEQAMGLIRGGVDILLLETCFDALNTKAAIKGIKDACRELSMEDVPVIVSLSVSDRSGRDLTGQTAEAFYTSIKHCHPVAFGLNCSLGADEMIPLVEDVARWSASPVICYPNAGLPNEMGAYDQSPETMAADIRKMALKGILNITGGCCGTTPAHIKAIADAVKGIAPRRLPEKTREILTVSGLESVDIDVVSSNFTNIGERTNVAGSRKFAKLIAAGDYDAALKIAAGQIRDGARIIDINMDDALLDSTREMEKFTRWISNDPDVSKAALMIDSSHWETLLSGLENAQGKCIVNSISLKEGEETFISKALEINSFGAAMVVMAFDEEGQATTFERKRDICARAYRLLTGAGIPPTDIIFDANILSIGTGIKEHAIYAVDYIEAVRWIKNNLPGALTSGGLSNLSFAFRGNNAVREAMHSAFLYHAIAAGLDMAILNPSMLQVYDGIEPEMLRCVEDVIFDKDPGATERLIEKAQKVLAAKEAAGTGAVTVQKNDVKTDPLERLTDAIVKGSSDTLESDLSEALSRLGKAVGVIEGPLMDGMEKVGKMFGEGKMFLPQVVKAAKVMRDAVSFLEPYMLSEEDSSGSVKKPKVVIATVKGDVHDIGKNITAIVLTCNGFDVTDLGVMVDRETILETAERENADIIAVSGLITPSLFQMEELCREMSRRGLETPLFIGGATTSALHTAVKLAPLYNHVFYGPDASASAVMAKRIMMDKEAFENEEHASQKKIRDIYEHGPSKTRNAEISPALPNFPIESFVTELPEDIPTMQIPIGTVLPYFDWRMFNTIWGVKYSSEQPDTPELRTLRKDAEAVIASIEADEHVRILLSAGFFPACSNGSGIVLYQRHGKTFTGRFSGQNEVVLPMFRQEQPTRSDDPATNGKMLSLCDFTIPMESGKTSLAGGFAICVKDSHSHTCDCGQCRNDYSFLVRRAVLLTLAEAASEWLDNKLLSEISGPAGLKIIKPAAGYASCPDHSLKRDILDLIPDGEALGISLTESFAMIPEASICGLIFAHPNAIYPDIRSISDSQIKAYAESRWLTPEQSRQLLSHLRK